MAFFPRLGLLLSDDPFYLGNRENGCYNFKYIIPRTMAEPSRGGFPAPETAYGRFLRKESSRKGKGQ